MKNIIILTIATLALGAFAAAQAPATPVPLIPAPVAANARTTADKQADAAKRIDTQVAQLQQVLKVIVGSIANEIEHNRDKLTKEQVLAGLGADKAASLAQAEADLQTLANKYAPGTFPTPAQ